MAYNFKVLMKSLMFTQLFIFCLVAGVSIDINSYYLYQHPFKQIEALFSPFAQITLNENSCIEIIKQSNYLLTGNTKNNIIEQGYYSVKIPRHFLTANLQALAFSEKGSGEAGVSRNKKENIELPAMNMSESGVEIDVADDEKLKPYKVVFYCTHSSESYIPDSEKANLNGGRYGLINQVAAKLAGNLNQKGIEAEFIKKIHDYPDYNLSYTNSRITVKQILATKGQKLWLFDIHRDSIPGLTEAQRVKIKGKHAAPVLIIVGTDERKEHPYWKKNLAFAEQMTAMAQVMYPGLIKGIRTKAGTYNQEFDPHSLLLEFGSDHNSLAEVRYSAELMANVILEMMKEEPNE